MLPSAMVYTVIEGDQSRPRLPFRILKNSAAYNAGGLYARQVDFLAMSGHMGLGDEDTPLVEEHGLSASQFRFAPAPAADDYSRVKALGLGLWLTMAISVSATSYRYQQLPFHGPNPPPDGPWNDTSSVGADPNQTLWADDFALPTTTAITRLGWWGNWYNRMPGQFQIRFYSDANGTPGNLLDYSTVLNLQETLTPWRVSDTYAEFKYTADLQTPFLAQSGTRYWISIANATMIIDNWAWEFSFDTQNPGYALSFTPGAPWQIRSAGNFSFSLAPEPTPSLLCGSAVVLWWAFRRRQVR